MMPAHPPATDSSGARRSAALTALAGPEPEYGVELALPVLAGEPTVEVLLSIVKAMVRSGLAGLALRLVDAMSADAGTLADLRARLALLPSGEIDATLLAERWSTRRSALVARRRDLDATLPHELLPGLVAYRSTRGNVQLVRPRSGGLDFFTPFEDAERRAASIALPALEPTTSFCFLGLPSEALLRRTLALVSPMGYVPAIDLIEPDGNRFAIWCATLEEACEVLSERCEAFVGANAREDYRAFVERHAWRTPATNVLAVRRAGTTAEPLGENFHRSYVESRAALRSTRVELIAERARGRTPAWWASRYRQALDGGEPLRLVGFTTRFSTVMRHAMQGIAAAFERSGCRFDAVMEPSTSAIGVDVLGALAATDYDGIVLINHLRTEYRGAIPAGIPVVSWIQDHMQQLCRREAGESVGDLDLVLAHAPDVLASLYGYPIERTIGTSNLTDPEVYSNEPLADSELAPYHCDVSFAAHGSESPEELIEMIATGNDRPVRAILMRALDLIRRDLSGPVTTTAHRLVEIMLEAEADAGVAGLTPELRRAFLYPQVVRVFDRAFRHEALEWTAQWALARGRRFRIYGHGWERHPHFGRFACGTVEGGRSLRALFQASSVSLQVNGHSSLHQRLLDGLAAGGFLLCRENPADWVRVPYTAIAEAIRTRGLRSLQDLVAARDEDPALDAACSAAERYAGVVIRALGDPRRNAHCEATERGNHIPELCTDQGLFETLASLRLIPTRVASDLPGFGSICFRDRVSLAALLDRFVDDTHARRSIAEPMRASVLVHDTYDRVVREILDRFASQVGSAA
jgi:hypothetical protein